MDRLATAQDPERMVLAEGAARLDHVIEAYAVSRHLSAQERRLLLATVKGSSEKEVAFSLGCRRSTTSTYWQRIFQKTGLRSQIEVLSAVLRWTIDAGSRRQFVDMTDDAISPTVTSLESSSRSGRSLEPGDSS
jgi:DNA-binding NarL/FixJ family response regulator